MRFSSIVAAAAVMVAGASAGSNDTYVTEVVTAYTTYCPEATQIVHGNVTYTVTSATTLTITNCPCTITKPVISSTVTYCPTCAPAQPPPPPHVYYNSSSPVSHPPAGTPANPPVGTAPPVKPPVGTAPPAKPPVGSTVPTAPIATFTGGADKAMAASGAGLAGLLALAAYIL